MSQLTRELCSLLGAVTAHRGVLCSPPRGIWPIALPTASLLSLTSLLFPAAVNGTAEGYSHGSMGHLPTCAGLSTVGGVHPFPAPAGSSTSKHVSFPRTCRTQHIGVCILSLFFYTPNLGLHSIGHARPKTQALDVHALVPCLQHLVGLERIELLSRWGWCATVCV